ncbi:MAG: PDZ domain-containing protein [Thermovirgaceae bacterium]|nr:PDZ domain-containing protein [Thermovirgaceae bacterium]
MKKLSVLAMILCLFLVSCPVAEALSKDMLIYDTMPVYFSSIEEGLKALSSLDGQLCAADGTPLKDIQLSSTQISFAAAGSSPYLVSFSSLFALAIVSRADDTKADFAWAVIAQASKDAPPVVIVAKNREAAEKLFYIVTSFAAAAGHPYDFINSGAMTEEPTKQDLKDNGLKTVKGGVVTHVLIGGVAEKAGLKAGDIILSINGLHVDSLTKFQEEVWPTIWPSAGKYDLEILRKKVPMSIHIEPRSPDSIPRPPAGLAFPQQAQKQGPKLGFSLRDMTESEIVMINGRTGAVIEEIVPGGEADKAKMQVGDVIISCNGKPLSDARGLGQLLTAEENIFVLLRNGAEMTIRINPVVVSY